MTIRYTFTLLALFFSTASASEETEINRVSNIVKNNLVDVSVQLTGGDSSHGKGFVVGATDEEFYIVTANHIVRPGDQDRSTKNNQPKAINVSLSDDEHYKADLMVNKDEEECDLAVLKIKKPKSHLWFSNILAREGSNLKELSTFNYNDEKELNKKTSVIESYKNFSFKTSLFASTGDSGSPILTEMGIIGMMYDGGTGQHAQVSDISACIIHRIRELFNKWKYPWHLYEIREETNLSGSWQIFEREDNAIYPGGSVEFEIKEDGGYKVTVYGKNGQKNGQGIAAYRDNKLYVNITFITKEWVEIKFEVPENLPKIFAERKVTLEGIATLNNPKKKKTEYIETRLVFLGREMIMDQWSNETTDPLDTSIRLPKFKLQKELSGSTWHAITKNQVSTAPSLYGSANNRIANQWEQGVYIRLNSNNSITVDPDNVPKETTNIFVNSWKAHKNIISLRLYRFSAKYNIPIYDINAKELKGYRSPDGSSIIKLTRVKKPLYSSKRNRGKNLSKTFTLYKTSGTPIYGKYYQKLKKKEYDKQRDYGWWRGDLKKADKIAVKYGISAESVMWIANSIYDEHDEENEHIIRNIVADAAFGLALSGQIDSRDVVASMDSPLFLELLHDIGRKVSGLNKKEMQSYLNSMTFDILKIQLIVQKCGTTAGVLNPSSWHEFNCDIERMMKIKSEDQIKQVDELRPNYRRPT